MQTLIAHGAHVGARDDRGRTPLHLAAESGHEEVVGVLVRCGAFVDELTGNGRTPAELAVRADYRPVVEYLVRAGVVETLRMAAYLGDVAKTESLIEKGADVNVGAGMDNTPLHLAAGEGHVEVVPVFRADHPFLFLIQENSTGSILFTGRVVNPTQTGQ